MLGLPCSWGAFHGDHFIHIWCLVFLAVMEVHPENGSNPLDSSLRMAITLSECSHLILDLPCLHRENGWSFYSYLGLGFPCFLAVAAVHTFYAAPSRFSSMPSAIHVQRLESWPRSQVDPEADQISNTKESKCARTI